MDFRHHNSDKTATSMAPTQNDSSETAIKTTTTTTTTARHTINLQELEGIKKPSVAELVNKFKCKTGQEPHTTKPAIADPILLQSNANSNNNNNNNDIANNKRSPPATTTITNVNHDVPTARIDANTALRPKYSGYGPDTLVIKPPLQEDNIQLKKGRSIAAITGIASTKIDQSFNNNQQQDENQHLRDVEEDKDYNNKYQANDEQANCLNSLVLRGFEQETVKRSSTSYDSRLPVPSDVFIDDQSEDHHTTNNFSSYDYHDDDHENRLGHQRLNDDEDLRRRARNSTSYTKQQTNTDRLDKEDNAKKNTATTAYIRASNHQPFMRTQQQQFHNHNNNSMPNTDTDSSDEHQQTFVAGHRQQLSNLKNATNNSDRPQHTMATLQSMMIAARGDEELSKNLAHLDMDTMQINHPSHHSRLRHHPMFFEDLEHHSDHIYNEGFLPSAQDDYYYYGHAGDEDEDYIEAHVNHRMMHHHLDEDDHLIDDMDQIDDNYLDYGLHTIVEEDENSEEEEEEGDEEVDNISLHDDEDVTSNINVSKLPESTTTKKTFDGGNAMRVSEIDYDLNKSATTKQQARIQMQPLTQNTNITPVQPNFSSPSSSTQSTQSSEEQPTEYQKQKPLQQTKSDRTPSDSSLNSGGLLMTIPLRISNSVSLPNISVKPSSMNCVKTTNDFNHKHTLRAQSPNSKNPLFLALEQHQLLQHQKQKILVKKMQKKNRKLNGHDHISKKDETCPQLSSLDLNNLDDKMIDDLMTHVINSSSASSASSDSSSSMSMDMDDACVKITTNDDNGCRIVGIHEDEQHDHLMFSHHHGVLSSLDDLRGSSDEDEELMLISSTVAAKVTEKLHKSCLLNNGNSQTSSIENRSNRNVISTHQSSNIDSHHQNPEETSKDNSFVSHGCTGLGKTLSMSVTSQNNCQQNQAPSQQHQNKQQQDSSLFLMAPSKLEQYFTSGLIKRSSGSATNGCGSTLNINNSHLSSPDCKQHDDCPESDRDDDEVNDCNDDITRKVSLPCDTNMSDRQLSSEEQNAASRVMGDTNTQALPGGATIGVQLTSNLHDPTSSSNLIQLQIESLMKQMLKTIQENSKSNKNRGQKSAADDKVSSNSSLQDFECNMRQLAQLIAASQSLNNSQHHIANSPMNSINFINLESTQNKQNSNQRAQSATGTSTSNNSDYGSDTQSSSADCLLQANEEEGLLAIIPSHHDQALYPSPPNSRTNLSQNHRQSRLQQQQQQQQHHSNRKLLTTTTISPILSKQSSLAEQMPPPVTAANSNQQQQHSSAPVAIELCQKMIESFKKLTEQRDTTVSTSTSTIDGFATKLDVTSSAPGVRREETCEQMKSDDRSLLERTSTINEQQKVKTVSRQEETINPESEEQKMQNDHHYDQERQLIKDEAYEYLKNQINNIMDTIQLQPNLSSLRAHNDSGCNNYDNNLEAIAKKPAAAASAIADEESSHDNSSHDKIIMNVQSKQEQQQQKSRPSLLSEASETSEDGARSDHQRKDKEDGNMIMTDSKSNQLSHESKDEDQSDDRGIELKTTIQPCPQPRNKHKTRISYNQSPSPVAMSSPSKPGPVVVTIGGGPGQVKSSGSQSGRLNIINLVNRDYSSQNSDNNKAPSSNKASVLDCSSSTLSMVSPITTSNTTESSSSPSISMSANNDKDNNASLITSPFHRSAINSREHASSKVGIEIDNSLDGKRLDANQDAKTELSSQQELSLSKEVQHPEKPRRTTKTMINVASPNSTAASYNNSGNNSVSAINTSPLTATVRVESPLSMPITNLNSNRENTNKNNNGRVKLDHHHQCVSQTTTSNNDGHSDSYSLDRSSLKEGVDHDKSNSITGENDNRKDKNLGETTSNGSIDSIQADQRQHLHQDQKRYQQEQLQQAKHHETTANNSIANKNNISSSISNPQQQQQQLKRKSSFYRPGSPVPSQLSLDLSSTDKTAPPTSTSGTMIRNFAMGALSPRVATSSSTTKIKQNSSDDDEGKIDCAIATGGKNKETLKKSTSASTTTVTAPSITATAKQQQQVAMSRSAAKALALAQKYNYSPSLLVAGKLGDNITNNSGSGGVGGKRAANQLSPLQLETNNICPDSNGVAISGSQASGGNGSLRRQVNQHTNTGNTLLGPIRVTGEVCFSISFQAKTNSMDVHVVECRNLAPVDKKRQRSNPYIKLYLLPDRSKSGKRKSAIKKADLNPKFDETFTFSQLGLRDLEQRTLWLSVWHKDRLGRNDFLGEIILPLESATQTLLQTSREHKWYKLQERFEMSNVKRNLNQASQFNGELFVALKFVPLNPDCRIDRDSDGDLHIIVKEAHNIRAFNRQIGLPNPYCKCQIITSRGHRLDKQKSPILKRTINPKWNHKFIFNQLLFGQLKELCIELSVWDRDSLVSNEFLGGVRLCLSSFSQAHFNQQQQQILSQHHHSADLDSDDKRSISTNGDTTSNEGTINRRNTLGKVQQHQANSNDANERPNQLWNQMLSRPNMWVYGELRLRRGKLNQSSSSTLPSVAINTNYTTDKSATTNYQDQSTTDAQSTVGSEDLHSNNNNNMNLHYLSRTNTIASRSSTECTTDDRESINSGSASNINMATNNSNTDSRLEHHNQSKTTNKINVDSSGK